MVCGEIASITMPSGLRCCLGDETYGRPDSAASAGTAPRAISTRARPATRRARERARAPRPGAEGTDRSAVASDMSLCVRGTTGGAREAAPWAVGQRPGGRVDVTPLHGLDR